MNKFLQSLLIAVIIVLVIIGGYMLLAPKDAVNDQQSDTKGLAQVENGKQIIKMTINGYEYVPNYFKVKAGMPVVWEITSSGVPSCASGAVVSTLLPGGSVYINPAAKEVTTTEFTPKKSGKFGFACTMGMVRGTIEVIN